MNCATEKTIAWKKTKVKRPYETLVYQAHRESSSCITWFRIIFFPKLPMGAEMVQVDPWFTRNQESQSIPRLAPHLLHRRTQGNENKGAPTQHDKQIKTYQKLAKRNNKHTRTHTKSSNKMQIFGRIVDLHDFRKQKQSKCVISLSEVLLRPELNDIIVV